ncbi:MAG: hypothetical protein LN413_07035, partial [Candidatus Thermoplasmatota archaeon]|nr:hypothetical protein [Candidatus Thermoplasmatota archaeon]
GDILLDSFAEIKIEEPLKFINGLFRVLSDIEQVAGAPFAWTSMTTMLSDFLRRLSTGEALDLGDIIDTAEDFLEDLGEGLKPQWRPGEAVPVAAGGPELDTRFIRALNDLGSTLGIIGEGIEPVAKLATTAFGWDKEKMENDAAILKKLVSLFSSGVGVAKTFKGFWAARTPAPMPRGGQPREFD